MSEEPSLRRLSMGLATLLGREPQGFFTPYRYAKHVAPARRYTALEALFDARTDAMSAVLDVIDDEIETLLSVDGPAPLPRWGTSWFPRLDAAATFAIVRMNNPTSIVEVGSGHSTRMLAFASDAQASIMCIDPDPRAALPPAVSWEPRVLSESDIHLFAALRAGDIAFFDSSHILWPGSDVDIVVNRILPVLAPGVLVHIHDITLPDPYPSDWEWRGYTEQNGLAGWLHGAYEIVFSSHFARTRMGAAERPGVSRLPMPDGALETSLWLRRLAPGAPEG